MKITAESTSKTVELNGVPARLWEAKTEGGVRCVLFVTRVMVHEMKDQSEFEKELKEMKAPSAELEAIPLRMIL